MSMDRYYAACHAMQSGVALKMNYDPIDVQPKHLRVGVNSALCDTSALARLLIAKGIISNEEYVEAITSMMEEEVKRYEAEISKHLGGKKVTLG